MNLGELLDNFQTEYEDIEVVPFFLKETEIVNLPIQKKWRLGDKAAAKAGTVIFEVLPTFYLVFPVTTLQVYHL